jgi:hypothetical protein
MTVIGQFWIVVHPAGYCGTFDDEAHADRMVQTYDGMTKRGPYVPAEQLRAVPRVDEEALVRATRAVKAGRMGRESNRAVVLAVLDALGIPYGGQ